MFASEFGGCFAEFHRRTDPISNNVSVATNLPWAVMHGPSSTVPGQCINKVSRLAR
jgi:hypothetical protein